MDWPLMRPLRPCSVFSPSFSLRDLHCALLEPTLQLGLVASMAHSRETFIVLLLWPRKLNLVADSTLQSCSIRLTTLPRSTLFTSGPGRWSDRNVELDLTKDTRGHGRRMDGSRSFAYFARLAERIDRRRHRRRGVAWASCSPPPPPPPPPIHILSFRIAAHCSARAGEMLSYHFTSFNNI